MTWGPVMPFLATLFNGPRTPSLDQTITLVLPHFYPLDKNTLARWSTVTLATLAVPYMEEVGQSVADTLWRIMLDGALRQHIPVGIWLWSSKQTITPPWFYDNKKDSRGEAVREFRALGDTEILKSYLLFIWLDWVPREDSALAEMCASIREDFNGIGMGHHREELRNRLDHVLGPEYIKKRHSILLNTNAEIPKDQYRELKRVLLEVDREAMEILTRTPSTFTILFGILTSVDTYRISLDVHV